MHSKLWTPNLVTIELQMDAIYYVMTSLRTLPAQANRFS